MSKGFEEGLEGLAAGPAASDGEAAAALGVEADASSHPTVAALREAFGDAVLRHEVAAGDEHVVFVRAERSKEVLGWLKDAPGHRYDLLKDVTAVDFGGGRPLQVVYQLWSIEHRRSLRVKVELPLDALEVDSVADLWASADWLERETYDMFGVRFRNHPDLRRILMPENYAEGHPLRKDFPLRGRFSRVEQTRRALMLDMESDYAPHELVVGRRNPEREQAVPAPKSPGA
ncbi:MAG TPA: NADH-quinone oxidoreductase subunit C [Longimicrobiales bacterium]